MILRKDTSSPLTDDQMDDNFVELSSRMLLQSNQTISGEKTFNDIRVPTPTLINNSIANLEYLRSNAGSGSFMLSSEFPLNDYNPDNVKKYIIANDSGIYVLNWNEGIGWYKFNNPSQIITSNASPNTIIKDQTGKIWYDGFLIPNVTAYHLTHLVGFDNARKISSNSHTFIEKSDGTVWCVGSNWSGQLGLGDNNDRNDWVQLPTEFNNPRKIVCGDDITFIEKSDGTVWSCGSNKSGQLGLGDTVNRDIFTLVPGISNLNKLITSGKTVIIEKSDGSIWGTGDNYYDQLSSDPYNDESNEFIELTDVGGSPTPDFVRFPDKIILDFNSIFILKNGVVYWAGYDDFNNDYGPYYIVSLDGCPEDVVDLDSTERGLVLITTDGSVYVHGDSESGELGYNEYNIYFRKLDMFQNAKNVYCTQATTIIVDASGNLYTSGGYKYGFSQLADDIITQASYFDD